MAYERAQEIAARLSETLRLISAGGYSTQRLAEQLGVSVPTASRYIGALRDRGFPIRAEKHGMAWRYVLDNSQTPSMVHSATRAMSEAAN